MSLAYLEMYIIYNLAPPPEELSYYLTMLIIYTSDDRKILLLLPSILIDFLYDPLVSLTALHTR